MKRALLAHQVQDGELRGSWDPIGLWDKAGGRVYTTALNTLNLEAYYRYLPLTQSAPLGLLSPTEPRNTEPSDGPGQARHSLIDHPGQRRSDLRPDHQIPTRSVFQAE